MRARGEPPAGRGRRGGPPGSFSWRAVPRGAWTWRMPPERSRGLTPCTGARAGRPAAADAATNAPTCGRSARRPAADPRVPGRGRASATSCAGSATTSTSRRSGRHGSAARSIRAAEAVGAFEPQPDDPVPGHEVSLAVISPRLYAAFEQDLGRRLWPLLQTVWPYIDYYGLRDAFVIRYALGEQEHLRIHHDVAQVQRLAQAERRVHRRRARLPPAGRRQHLARRRRR